MHATENKPPATNPTKARYLVQDIQRSAQLCKIKLRKPKEFPAQSVLAMRCLVLLQRRESRELMVNASRVLWEFYWTEQGDISDFEAIRRILLEKLNIRVSEEEINALEVKDALKKNTRDAVDLGAFGFPWMLVYKNGEEHKGKIVFGSDRFAHIAQIMGLNVQEYMPPKSRI
jgi:glutathione S-transferase kappa 1